ncbi:GTPase-activating Rap/Ran-GAP domain-like protein 3 [Xenotaenia resolanae]|uniref:GTPase-activating Rap/Ran-GAP domain-like protein 3 n=1 Tax=Xenotaenia resolanae TaxID=208358 RepID=A0ABV0W3M1_9TELE
MCVCVCVCVCVCACDDQASDYTPGTWRRTDVHLENPEYHTRWYFKYFLGKVHQNYVGTDAEKNPFYLSVVLSDQNNQRVPQYRAILWRKTLSVFNTICLSLLFTQGTLKISLPYSPTKTLSVKSILRTSASHYNRVPEFFMQQVHNAGVVCLQHL